ncbi:MAG: Rieske (2Fe-2S) protein [Phycisphaeraceae bacterium]
MAKWIDIGPAQDFTPGSRQTADVGEHELVVFNVEDQLYAVNNVCPHAGLPLEDGEVAGRIITCPFHGYTYDLKSGRNVDRPHDEPPVSTFPVREHDGRVEVQMAGHGDGSDNGEGEGEGPEDESGEEDAQRGPAPVETPAEGDEGPPCEPEEEPGPPTAPECPEGYEDRPPTRGTPQ